MIANIRFFMFFAALWPAMHTFAHAASSEWQDLGGGQVRIIAELEPKTNQIKGAVEVVLEPGWTTYWRYPGSSGIPPQFDFSRSNTFVAGDVAFPAPSRFEYENGAYAGYKNQVLFPFSGQYEGNIDAPLTLDLLIGVCSDICIPAKASMSIQASALLQSDPTVRQQIQLATLRVPVKRDADKVVLNRTLTGKDKMQLTFAHKNQHGNPQLFVEGPSDWYLQPAQLIRQEEDRAIFELDLSQVPKETDVMAQKLRYTLVTGKQGIETVR